MHKKRTLESSLLETSKSFKVALVTGPRQVGKTTLMQIASAKNRKYITLDDKEVLLQAKTDPKGFLSLYNLPIFIDEIQYAPELFSYIKMLVDGSDKRGTVWMSGSQAFDLMQGVTESLAGRVGILDMLGFSIYETQNKGKLQKPFLPKKNRKSILTNRTPKSTFKAIWQGSFPDVVSKNEKGRQRFYDSYIRTYIERDVRKIINISDEIAFIKFLKVSAARTGQELNLSDIAKDVDISVNTAKKWLSILRTSGLVYLLQPYFKNVTKRLVKTPKLYWTDTGLAAYLAGWTTTESLETGISAGAFFETFVISEIIKSYYNNGYNPTLYYFRDSNGNEIDLLIQQDSKFYPIEIKKTSTPRQADIKAFNDFAKIEKLGYGNLICLTDKKQPLSAGATAISIWDI
ncbi:MAG: ATP-binding protein [Endomicrobium sp.]|nr:ATP-binding protein [Endomicrobium sp.]